MSTTVEPNENSETTIEINDEDIIVITTVENTLTITTPGTQ